MKNVHLVLLISPINKVGKIIIKIHPGLNERECNVSDLNGATFTTFLISFIKFYLFKRSHYFSSSILPLPLSFSLSYENVLWENYEHLVTFYVVLASQNEKDHFDVTLDSLLAGPAGMIG